MPIGKACPGRGCGRTIARGARWCERCAVVMEARERARQRDVDARRPTGPQRSLYQDPDWRRASAALLRERRWCECGECLEHERAGGARLPSGIVDHVVPHRGDPRLFWDRKNWRALARSCHSRKTARADGGFGNPRKG